MTQKISSSNIETATLASFSGPTIANVSIANSSYTILDDTAVSNAGGYVVITGSNFQSGAQVLFGSTSATSVTFVDSARLNVQVPALTAGSYVVYVQNGDGSTAVRLNGITSSPIPVWSTGSTLTEQGSGTPISISLSATSDSNVAYSVANGSSLPSGTTLAANGLFSGTVTIENDTTYNFSVNAIDTENQETLRAFSVNVIVADAFYYLTTLHLVDNGTNNANNNVFNDSSNNNFAITRNGNTTQGTFSPFSQTGWSNYFDGTTDYLTTSASSNFGMGTGTFSFECWIFPTANPANGIGTIFDARNGANAEGWVVRAFADRTIGLYNGPANAYVYSTGTVTLNQWNHIAVVRSSTSSGGVAFYINGAAAGTATVSSNLGTSWAALIASNYSAGFDFNGYISNLRVVKGAVVYSAAFTPSTVPLTTFGSGTNALLTCQSNRFVDNSGNALTLTITGTPSVQAFSPFAPTAAYSAATVGGSGYFDGTGDYLSITNNTAFKPGTGDFTVEFWGYLFNQNGAITSGGTSSVNIQVRDGSLELQFEAVSFSATFSLSGYFGIWNHYAYSRTGGVTRMFINGSLVNSVSETNNYQGDGATFNIGVRGASFLSGYISNFRFIKGTAVYTSAFTPPTAPLTNITNTSLLLNFTNAGITDATAKNVLETLGNAQVSTVQSKFGGSSILFDGTDDALIAPYSPLFNLGTGQFTIEAWVNFSTLSGNRLIFDTYTAASTGGGYQLYWRGTGTSITFYGNGVVIAQSTFTSHVTGTWYHIAVTRDSVNSLRIFVDGTQYANTTYSTALNIASTAKIGVGIQASTLTNDLSGYVDDLRVTLGQARYTSNFTAPTAAFKIR
jgi:hypothetical protein